MIKELFATHVEEARKTRTELAHRLYDDHQPDEQMEVLTKEVFEDLIALSLDGCDMAAIHAKAKPENEEGCFGYYFNYLADLLDEYEKLIAA